MSLLVKRVTSDKKPQLDRVLKQLPKTNEGFKTTTREFGKCLYF